MTYVSKTLEKDIYYDNLPIRNNHAIFPAKIHVYPYNRFQAAHNQATLESQDYVPLIFCDKLITMDEDKIVGSCTCSRCHESLNPFYKFCPHCGAKAREKKIFMKKSDLVSQQDESLDDIEEC